MSEIFVDTIKNKAGSTSLDSDKLPDMLSGSAKAWLNMDGTNTVAIRDSFNTSSITDVSTGRYKQLYTNNMSSDDYSVSTSSANNSGYIESIKVNRYNLFEPIATSEVEVACWNSNSAWTDAHFVLLQSFGDLA